MSRTLHIFCDMVPSKELLTQLKKQRKSLRTLKTFSAILCTAAIISEVRQRNLKEELYRLSVRVKKLERNEEE